MDEETALREAEAAFDARDYARARAILTPLAERGNPRAQNGLGILYGRGLGVPQDLDQAFKLHQQAARQGYGLAQYYLGLLYADGQGVPEDAAAGAKWLRAAAEQGVSNAQFTLGVMYEKGEGVEQDSRQAAAWYRQAAEQGHASAQYHLALLYARGEGILRNPAEALRWEQKAAEHGDARAQYRLGLRYAEGAAGVPRDPRAAFQWIRQALEGYPVRLELEPGWTVGHYGDRPGQAAILEFVRAGDAIERWQELLTLQQFPPQESGPSVREVFQRLQTLRETACPGATVWKVIHQDAPVFCTSGKRSPVRVGPTSTRSPRSSTGHPTP
ncbi:MAG: tetratricopeptide repeat protein [Candidatus Competibacteraceae bacterium]